MISVKYQNQIVTTLNPYFKENDSILKAGKLELAKAPAPMAATKKTEARPKIAEEKKTSTTPAKPKESAKPKTHTKEAKKTEKKSTAKALSKPKAKVKIE